MFVSTVLLATLAVVGAVPVPNPYYQNPGDDARLENYDTYHTRYLAIGCKDKHNTAFWEDCCHPMLKTETLEKNRKPECNPANLPSPQPTQPAPAPAPPAPPATPPVQTPPDDDDGDDDYCDDDGDEDDHQGAPSPPPSPAPAPPTYYPPPPSNDPPSSPPSNDPPPPPPSNDPPPPPPSNDPPPSNNPPPPPNNGGGAGDRHGYGTYYYQGGNAGACGNYRGDYDFIVAMQSSVYNNGALCGKSVQITNDNNGKSAIGVVADECPSCVSSDSIDMSYGMFTSIASEGDGMVPITWKFV